MSRRVRFLAIFLTGLLAVLQLLAGQSVGWFLLVAVVMLTYCHLRYGSVWLAYRRTRAGRVSEAEQLLGEIKRPDYLAPQSRAYYQLLQASLASERGDYSNARRFLAELIVADLRTEHDRCLAYATHAGVMLELGEVTAAREHLAQVQLLERKGNLAPHLEELAERIAAP